MRRVLVLAALSWSAMPLTLAQPSAPDILFYARARTKMRDHLNHQPNYVCLETIERAQKDPRKKRSELLDVLRLEVAFVEHKEIYAWPGSNRFEEKELVDMVPAGGTIGSGAFATHAYNLFFSAGPRTLPGEWVEADGHRFARYPYEVAEMVSGYKMRVARSNWAVVGYKGFIWIDAVTEDVTKIEVHVDEIPLQLGLKESTTTILYGDLKIGDQSYRLPVETIETVTTFSGHENRNDGRFTGCRQFVGESKLSFGDPPPEESAPIVVSQPAEDMALPEGLAVDLEIITPIDSDRTQTGDLIEARLGAPIKQKKRILFEKGTRVEGRLVRLQKSGGRIEAELQFPTITSATAQTPFTASAQSISPSRDSLLKLTLLGVAGRPGWVRIEAEGSHLSIPRGTHIPWITNSLRTNQ